MVNPVTRPTGGGRSLHDRLRTATRESHANVEATLDLLATPASPAHILQTLQRFYGFHAAWEPALRSVIPAPVLQPRLKTALLEQDVLDLGCAASWFLHAPLCQAARNLCNSEAAAAGSLYVMEGATLGGQVIGRALADAPWLPPHGLRYWNPYRNDTGRRWTETLKYLEGLPEKSADETIQSADACFGLLLSWFTEGAHESVG